MRPTLLLPLLAAAFPFAASAADWPHWRGPNMDGSSDATGVPTTFSPTENVRWSVDLPGSAGATPLISGGKVFISSTNEAEKKLLAYAFDLKSGKQLWEHTIGEGLAQDNRSNYAGASPVTDGKHVVFFYGTGTAFESSITLFGNSPTLNTF